MNGSARQRQCWRRQRRRQPQTFWTMLLLLSMCCGVSAICTDNLVMLDFEQSQLVNNNFGGRNVASGMPPDIRFRSVATYLGRSIDLVLDSPDHALLSTCTSGNCAAALDGHGVAALNVSNNRSLAYRVRWNFEWSDGAGKATLPKLAVTWVGGACVVSLLVSACAS